MYQVSFNGNKQSFSTKQIYRATELKGSEMYTKLAAMKINKIYKISVALCLVYF